MAGVYGGEVAAGEEAQVVEGQETLKTTRDYSLVCGWRNVTLKFVATEECRKRVRFRRDVDW